MGLLRKLRGSHGGDRTRTATPHDGEWLRYASPSGLFSLSHPRDWIADAGKGNTNIVNFDGPQSSGALTASGYFGRLTPDEERQVFSGTFGRFEPISKPVTVLGDGWSGTRQSFIDRQQAPPVFVDVVLAHGDEGFVLLTWNEPMPAVFGPDGPHARAFSSLALQKPRGAR